jgi:hypothetical protein
MRRGHVDDDDPIFSKLKIWVDSNHNGLSEADELLPFGRYFSSIAQAYERFKRRQGIRDFATDRSEIRRASAAMPEGGGAATSTGVGRGGRTRRGAAGRSGALGGKQRLTATRLHELLLSEGHRVGVTVVKDGVTATAVG